MQDFALGTDIHDVVSGGFGFGSNCVPHIYVDLDLCLRTRVLFAFGFCVLSDFGYAQLVGIFGAWILRKGDIRECPYLS